MKAPESTWGKVAWALGILGGGAAAGAAAGALATPSGKSVGKISSQTLGGTLGALGGVALTSFGSLAALEFLDGEEGWKGVEGYAALIGGGLVAAGVTYSVVSTLGEVSAFSTPSETPALPPAGAAGANYTATETDSGKTLNMAAGDTLTLTLPGAPWSLAATSGLVTIQSQSTDASSGSQTFVLVAGVGSGSIQATPAGGGALFTLNVNVVG